MICVFKIHQQGVGEGVCMDEDESIVHSDNNTHTLTLNYILSLVIKSPLRTVQRWSKWFRESREEVVDEERPGRPVTETTHKHIDQVGDLIKDDLYLIVDEI